MKQVLMLVLMVLLISTVAMGDVKATAQITTLTCQPLTISQTSTKNSTTGTSATTSTPWTNIMHSSIATSNSVSLLVDTSLVTGIVTDVTGLTCTTTTTNSQGQLVTTLCKSGGTASGKIEVVAVLDATCNGGAECQPSVTAPNSVALASKWDGNGVVAFPAKGQGAGVTFQENVETLEVQLGQALAGCTIDSSSGNVTCGIPTSSSACVIGGIPDGTCGCAILGQPACGALLDQSVRLMLQNTNAHSFNFVMPNVGNAPNSAPHRVDIFARVADLSAAPTGGGSAEAKACYGWGSAVVDVVRLGHGFSCSSTGCGVQ